MAMGIGDGVGLMRASVGVVRQRPSLLWFPVISTVCLALTAGFWIAQGAFVYASHGSKVAYVPLVVAALYSLTFVGVFFNVALAGATAETFEGDEPSFGDGMNVAWNNLGGIAGWAAYSIAVAIVLSFVRSIKGARWIGAAAQIAWNLATIFVVPLMAIEDLDASDARRRSLELAKQNWKAETGGLGALRLALVVPGLLIYFDAKLLGGGHVHSLAGKAVLGGLLLCGFGVAVGASVVRQVFAVELYRSAAPSAAG
jgi:Family of unknown function (DUF6159)